MSQPKGLAVLTLGAIGVVYGDIGTSPLYTVKEIFGKSTGIALTHTNILGAVSAIFWALMFVVSLKYVMLVLRADNKGEGGIMALLALASSGVQHHRTKTILFGLGVFGAALFYGDSLLTPAISVLSAVEGLSLITPKLTPYVLPVSITILIGLFFFQKKGTAQVGKLFGPIIVIWFLTLGAIGVWNILKTPAILQAINPLYALEFYANRGAGVFLAVGAVVLAITGSEALYADMGHFGRPAIRIAWSSLVLPGLALNYFGQGALLLAHPEAVANPFYFAFPSELLIPAVILSTLATIIASQAVISGAYSITRQAIQLGFLPRMRILHTSAEESGQIYIPAINWALLVAVILTVIAFKNSSAIAAAYGIAVTGTMLMTSILTFFVVRNIWQYPLWIALGATGIFISLDVVLLASCTVKFFSGGWFPIVLAMILVVIMWTWRQGREALMNAIHEDDPKMNLFIKSLANSDIPRIERTAVYLNASSETVPQALLHNLKHNQVLHKTNLIITVFYADIPTVPADARSSIQSLGEGFWQIRLNYGFIQQPDIPQALMLCEIPDFTFEPFSTSYFFSRETIVTGHGEAMAKWRAELFSVMSRNAGSVVSYFNIPSNSVIELGSRVHI
jgi:KUP system potassium uptake protein